jgi:hypothetical protein
VVENNMGPAAQDPAEEKISLGDEVLKLLGERTKNPSEAFVLLQQICVFLWAQYKIDWHGQESFQVAESRKQRYLDFISAMIDNMSANSDPAAENE